MKRCRLRLLKILSGTILCWLGVCGAMGADNIRFLLLIDHSPDMATRQISTAQTVYDLVRTGFQNQIQPGEQFALWFYGSRLQTNAPFVWQPGREIAYARQAANLFSGRIYSRLRPRDPTLADAAPIIAASPMVTILIFTDGAQPLSGTPYDAAINSVIEERRVAFLRADKPFIITLLAKKGQLVGGSVHADVNAPFKIPDLEHPPELMDKALAAVRTAPASNTKTSGATDIDKARDALRDALAGKTNAPIPVGVMQFAPTLKEIPKETPEAPKEEIKKEAIKKEEPKEEKPAVLVAETPPPKAQEPKAEPPPPKTEPVVTKPIEVAAAPVVKEPEPKPVVVTPQPQPIKEEPKPAVREEPKPVRDEPKPVVHEPPKVVAQETPKPSPQQAPAKIEGPVQAPAVISEAKVAPPKSEPKAPAPVQTATVTPPRSKGFPWFALTGGLFTILGFGAIAVLNARKRARSAGSIITQALPQSGAAPRRKT